MQSEVGDDTAALLPVGCDYAPLAPDAQGVGAAPQLRATTTGSLGLQPPATASERLAALVPTFGGAVVDVSAKTLVVYLTDLANAASAKSPIERDLSAHGRPELSVTFRQGRYTFTQLEAWRDSLLLGFTAGVVLGEIDERVEERR